MMKWPRVKKKDRPIDAARRTRHIYSGGNMFFNRAQESLDDLSFIVCARTRTKKELSINNKRDLLFSAMFFPYSCFVIFV